MSGWVAIDGWLVQHCREKIVPNKTDGGRWFYFATVAGFFRKSISRPFQQATPTLLNWPSR
jgi:hypothetical protein